MIGYCITLETLSKKEKGILRDIVGDYCVDIIRHPHHYMESIERQFSGGRGEMVEEFSKFREVMDLRCDRMRNAIQKCARSHDTISEIKACVKDDLGLDMVIESIFALPEERITMRKIKARKVEV